MVLGIQLAQRPYGIAFVQNKQRRGHISFDGKTPFGDNLVDHVYTLASQIGIALTDIKAIGVVKGPGGYTGLRIGITVANTLSQLIKCPIYGQSALETMIMAYAAFPGTYVVIMPAIQTQITAALFGVSSERVQRLTADFIVDETTLTRQLASVTGHLTVLGVLPDSIQALALSNTTIGTVSCTSCATIVATWAEHQWESQVDGNRWIKPQYSHQPAIMA